MFDFGLNKLFRARGVPGQTWHRTLGDPLLVAAVIVLVIALIGVIVSLVAAILGVVLQFALHSPIGESLRGPAWDPVSSLILAIWALTVIASGIGDVLKIVGSVADADAFVPDNAARVERLAWRVIELQVIGWIARGLDVAVGGTVRGHAISVDLGGANALAFALILFVLARVFRQGNRMRGDLEGTV